MKVRVIVTGLVVVALTAMLAGCGPQKAADTKTAETTKAAETTATQAAEKTQADAVTTASIVDNADALAKAMSKDGNWIMAILNDVTTDKELVLEGDFHDKGDAAKDLYRKMALYSQDENHKVTARFTLTAPKLTIKSPNAKIQGGTFKGDVYVEANGFTVQDATVEGNIFFAKQEYKDSFVLPTEEGKAGKVTGTMEVK